MLKSIRGASLLSLSRKGGIGMTIIIGYIVVLCMVALDFYYNVYVNKDRKTYIYTPFDAASGHYGFFYEEQQIQEKPVQRC